MVIMITDTCSMLRKKQNFYNEFLFLEGGGGVIDLLQADFVNINVLLVYF